MENNKRNQFIIIGVIVTLLLVVIGFIFYSIFDIRITSCALPCQIYLFHLIINRFNINISKLHKLHKNIFRTCSL